MDPWYALLNNQPADVHTLPFDDMIQLLYAWEDYVRPEDETPFSEKGLAIQNKYKKELNEIELYEQNEYQQLIKQGKGVPFGQRPETRKAQLKAFTKEAIANLIIEYFNKDFYLTYKDKKDNKVELKGRKTTAMNFLESLVTIRDRLGVFLGMVGFYVRYHGYFLSSDDVKEINDRYNKDASLINKHISGINVDLFNRKTSLGNVFNKTEVPYVEIDNVSLQNLIAPYFKTNLNELMDIIDIIYKAFFYHGTFEEMQQEISTYMDQCIALGRMIKL